MAYAKRRCDGAGSDSEGWWFKSYLSNRQRTVINAFTSAPCQVTSGVPQGSILGPLLFIMFMNSLTKVPLSDNAKLILYADDILLYKPVNSDQDSDAFQQDVNSIQNWTNSHGLKLNASESCLMNMTRAKNPPRLSITVDGSPITCVQQTKCLGVTISADLTWSNTLYIDHTCKSAKRHLGMIHRKFHQSSPQVRKKLYSSVILPKLEYCCSVWDPHQRKYMYPVQA